MELRVLLGPNGSGKTSVLFKRVSQALKAGKRALVFKPLLDWHYYLKKSSNSFLGIEVPVFMVNGVDEMAEVIEKLKPDFVAVDDAHFFSKEVHQFLFTLTWFGVDVFATSTPKRAPELIVRADALEHIAMESSRVNLYTGTMYSGKTTRAVFVAESVKHEKRKIAAFKPSLDDRYDRRTIRTHSGLEIKGIEVHVVEDCEELRERIEELDINVAVIEEAQFFSNDIAKIIEGSDVEFHISALNLDFKSEPWETTLAIASVADYVEVQRGARCEVCGAVATQVQRIVNGKPASVDDPLILVGGLEYYRPRCKRHHKVIGRKLPFEDLVRAILE